MSVFGRIRDSLSRTTQQIVERFEAIVQRADAPERRMREVDVATLEALEELLISADIGLPATEPHRVGRQGARAPRREPARPGEAGDPVGVRAAWTAQAPRRPIRATPRVVLVVGVNGTGKTTTVGKLANLYKMSGATPLVCAADTFRAAAVEQLEIWARRAGVDIVRAREGADPAAVVFDACRRARPAAATRS